MTVPTLLDVDRLNIRIGNRVVVGPEGGVSFSLAAGETLALVGESGSGKSLTALAALRLLPPGATASGRITLDGVDVLTASSSQLRRLRGGVAGMVFQEPMTSLNPLHRVGRQITEAIQLHQRLNRRQARARAVALLQECGFADASERMDRFAHQLSGGQRQRVMIAMALANDPRLVIADEPTTALDVTIQAQILDLLAREKAQRGLAMLLISHDLAVVRRYADKVCVMRHGVIVEAGPAAQVFGHPQHEYTKMLLNAEPRGAPTPIAPDAPMAAQVEDLRVSFPIRRGVLQRVTGTVQAVDGVSFDVREGETLGLVGESGSGKSTTGFAVLKLERSTGIIRLGGVDLAGLDAAALRRERARAQIVFQDPYGSLSPRLSVGDIVAEGLLVHEPHLTRAMREARVAEALTEVGLSADMIERFPHEFSGGQRQRIAIARAMALKPRFVVMDEPTSALDRSVQSQIIDLLRALQDRHRLAYLFISHDLAVVRALAHRVMVMRHGRIVEQGTATHIFQAPQHPYTKTLLAAAFDLRAAEVEGV